MSLNMQLENMSARGILTINALGTIKINDLSFVNMGWNQIPLFFPISSDMILQIGEIDMKLRTLIENAIFQYQVESEISSNLKMTFEGRFGGRIGDILDLTSYDLVFANNFFVGTGYASQEFNNNLSFKNGILDLESHVNTVLLQADINLRISGWKIEKLILDNILINTKIHDDELYVIGGIVYEKNVALVIKQTQVNYYWFIISAAFTVLIFTFLSFITK